MQPLQNHSQPLQKIVVMGVAGCGKSTLGLALANALSARFIEGDDLHSPAAVEKMRAGLSLTDADREPWLQRIGQELATATASVCVSCSALKRRYRDALRASEPQLRFVYVAISEQDASARVTSRLEHYMPQGLVRSQFLALEVPSGELQTLHINANDSTNTQQDLVLQWLQRPSLVI